MTEIDLDLLADKVAERLGKSENNKEDVPRKKKRKMEDKDRFMLSKLLKLKPKT